MKYVVVSGGVVSGLGKGITSSSLGVLLQAAGLTVTSIKIDPYLNTDAGTMSPYEHGEVYVLDDGGEADLDLGNYERFMDITLTRKHNITTGKVYQQVISRERKGDYLGKTVQVVPHVTDAIQQWIEHVATIPVTKDGKLPDVCMIELGGTVGDIESMIFLEALRQFKFRVGSDNFCHVHVSLVPVVGAVGEPKSKPTQHGVKALRAAGLSPDIITCRSTNDLPRAVIAKISLFCMVPATHVISLPDVSNLYKVPLALSDQRVDSLILNVLRINKMPADSLPEWEQLSDKVENCDQTIRIGVVGKYTGLSDSYLSVIKSLSHASIACNLKLKIVWINSVHLEDFHAKKKPEESKQAWEDVKSVDGILIPGGFGNRGVNGKVAAVQYARENKVPYLGICLGMQVAVIEYARNVLKLEEANSEEFDKMADDKVIVYMPEISQTQMGGTMRLGTRPSIIAEKTLAHQLYGTTVIDERHRHRYEVNPEYVQKLSDAGLVFSGKDDKKVRMECTELSPDSDHPFFLGVQFHPEFQSRPLKPSPPFRGFVQAAAGKFKKKFSAPNSPTQER